MRVAIQMDGLSSLNLKTDSTLMIAFSMQLSSHQIYCYSPHSLCWHEGLLYALVTSFSVDISSSGFVLGPMNEAQEVALSEFDLILIRQDPPFDMHYITCCELLMMLPSSTKVLNSPRALLNFPEKISVLRFPQHIPSTLICQSISDRVEKFIHQTDKVVAKPLYGYAGLDVTLLKDDYKEQLRSLLQRYGSVILQRFLPKVCSDGDKRVFMINGEVVGAFQRLPLQGQIRANLAAGGTAATTTLDDKELELCRVLSPMLRENDLFFAGVDLLDGHLIEINVTSPTGLTTLYDLQQLLPTTISGAIEEYCL